MPFFSLPCFVCVFLAVVFFYVYFSHHIGCKDNIFFFALVRICSYLSLSVCICLHLSVFPLSFTGGADGSSATNIKLSPKTQKTHHFVTPSFYHFFCWCLAVVSV